MRGVKVLLKYILGILLKGREFVNNSNIKDNLLAVATRVEHTSRGMKRMRLT